MQLNETVRASSCFHHSTRTLAPGESLPPFPSLLEQVVACRNAMLNQAANDDEAEDAVVAEDSLEDAVDDELDS
ncbi:MAG: hypothetical protein WCF44_09450 [Candidatus Methylophosphatis roskildensis]|jgi:hypothetical protein|uniref:Uncharacterized protein n=1 Tax=Candidatus Methylophosphatis roskildensis TaxID=2899263 RepID=A0A9D7HQN9_9PROT|nr:hypothetical protein [Candidatus Methylophosphatis roskildensis]MBK7235870.1 hypothetical protein [Sterolibacteriaceae bacterium]